MLDLPFTMHPPPLFLLLARGAVYKHAPDYKEHVRSMVAGDQQVNPAPNRVVKAILRQHYDRCKDTYPFSDWEVRRRPPWACV